jgi:DHA1 family bicyclomycin/chloramphenicol resistance-like MFS transporter
VFDAFKEPQMIGLVFGAVAAPMALASWLNSRLVGRFGLRRVGHSGAAAFATLTLAHALFATVIGENLIVFALLQSCVMASFAFCSANLNTLAMQNMASIAGMASSIQGVIGTIFAAIGGFAIGQAFDGTQLPFLWGLSLAGAIGLGLIVATEPKRMFELIAPSRGSAPSRPAQPAE